MVLAGQAKLITDFLELFLLGEYLDSIVPGDPFSERSGLLVGYWRFQQQPDIIRSLAVGVLDDRRETELLEPRKSPTPC